MEIHRESSRVFTVFGVLLCIIMLASLQRLLCRNIRTVAASDSFVRTLHFVATQWLIPATGFRVSSRSSEWAIGAGRTPANELH